MVSNAQSSMRVILDEEEEAAATRSEQNTPNEQISA